MKGGDPRKGKLHEMPHRYYSSYWSYKHIQWCMHHPYEKPWSHTQNSNTTLTQLPQYMQIHFAKLWSLYVLKSAQEQNLCICNMLCGGHIIYFIHITCTVWFIFLSGKWRNTNDKKLDRTNCQTKEMIPMLCTVIAHKSTNQLVCTAKRT